MAKDTNRTKALDALTEHSTLTAASSAAGISRRTLYSYLHDDADFMAAYQQQREQATIEQAERLANERQKVLDTISGIMTDDRENSAARLKAATILLNAIDSAQKQVDAIAAANISKAEQRDLFSGLKGWFSE